MIAIVPASVFFIQIPKYTTICLCVVFVLTFLLCLKTTVRNAWGRVLLSVFSLFALAFSVLGNYCNPYWNSINFKNIHFMVSASSKPADTMMTEKDALKDLEYAMYYLTKLHPAFYRQTPPEVQRRYETVHADLKHMDQISVCELARKIEYIFSVLRDGHTYVKLQPKELHYRKDIDQLKRNHSSVTAVNGNELFDLLEQTNDLYSFEAPSWHLSLLKSDLSSLEGLQYLGFPPEEEITFTYESEDGQKTDYTYDAKDFLTYEEYAAYNQFDAINEDEESFVSYELDREHQLAILSLDSCYYNKDYKACVREMFAKVKEQGIRHVAVDLRYNGGGDSRVANEFIRYLNVDTWKEGGCEWRFGWFKLPFPSSTIKNDKYDDLTFDGQVYILTSSNSFSSAMLFAQYIKDNHMGTLIGEAPGNTPNGYGDIAMFRLPHSQLFMQISTKEFFRIDTDNPAELVEPDLSCKSEDAVEVLYENIR